MEGIVGQKLYRLRIRDRSRKLSVSWHQNEESLEQSFKDYCDEHGVTAEDVDKQIKHVDFPDNVQDLIVWLNVYFSHDPDAVKKKQ